MPGGVFEKCAQRIVRCCLCWTTGGLFDSADPMPESAFRQSLDRVNEYGRFLPNSNLMSIVERLPSQDSFYASKRGQVKRRLILYLFMHVVLLCTLSYCDILFYILLCMMLY